MMLGLISIVINPVEADQKLVPTEDDINTWRYGALILPENASKSSRSRENGTKNLI